MRIREYFSNTTAIGQKRCIVLLVAVILVASFTGQMISTDGGRIKVEQISLDVRGAALTGELYYPAGTTDEDKYPAVVVVPGAGVIHYQMRSFAEELAKQNFVVFNLNAYGSGYSETPVYNENDQGINEYNIFGTPMGCLDAVNYLRTVEFVDDHNIGVTGHSQGSRRSGYAALMDCGYYTFNDILLNLLHDTFLVDVTLEDITTDADSLAYARLDANQLRYYEELKLSCRETYDSMIRSACLVGSTAQYVNPTQEVIVAGHSVMRNCQVSLGIINGTFDYGYVGFNNSEDVKKAWYLDPNSDVVQGGYYTLDDNTGSSRLIGTFRNDTVSANPELRVAIENRTLRMVGQTKETHPKNFFSRQTSAMVIDFFNQTLGNNTTIASTSPSSIHFMWREACNGIAMVAMILLLFPIIRLFTMTRVYSGCVLADPVAAPDSKRRKLANIVVIVGTLVLNALAIYLVNGKHPIFKHSASATFPLMITCWSPIQFLEWMCVMGCILAVIYSVITNSFQNLWSFIRKQFAIGPLNILRCLLISISFLICGYFMFSTVQYLFLQDFRVWQVAFGAMKCEHWFIASRYFLLALPFMLLSNIASNYLADMTKGQKSEGKDCLLNVLITIGGVWLLCLINIIVDYSGMMPGKSITSFMLTYGAILFLPVMALVNRKAYQLTKNVWVSSFTSALLLSWMLVSVSGTNGSYVPQTWISNFFGV